MTTLTLRYIKGDFVVTGPDIEPVRFKTRREAKDWCGAHYPTRPSKRSVRSTSPPRGATSGEEWPAFKRFQSSRSGARGGRTKHAKQWQSISKRAARCCAVARSSMRH